MLCPKRKFMSRAHLPNAPGSPGVVAQALRGLKPAHPGAHEIRHILRVLRVTCHVEHASIMDGTGGDMQPHTQASFGCKSSQGEFLPNLLLLCHSFPLSLPPHSLTFPPIPSLPPSPSVRPLVPVCLYMRSCTPGAWSSQVKARFMA